jgi:DNA-binding transcriptional LysR family regulator
MRIELLEEFVVFANHLNFSRAAKELHLTQPALSKHMRLLEQELGLTLIDRDVGIALTSAGRVFLDKTYKTLEDYHLSIKAAASTITHSVVRIHDLLISTRKWTKLLGSVNGIELKTIRINPNISEIDALDEGLIDVGLLLNPVITERIERLLNTRGLAAVSLPAGRASICMSKKHPLASKKALSRKDLEGAFVTVFTAKQYDAFVETVHYMLGDDLDLVFRHNPMSNDADIYLMDLEDSIHICGAEANLNHSLYRDDVVIVEELEGAELCWPAHLIYKTNNPNDAVHDFIGQVKELTRSEAETVPRQSSTCHPLPSSRA